MAVRRSAAVILLLLGPACSSSSPGSSGTPLGGDPTPGDSGGDTGGGDGGGGTTVIPCDTTVNNGTATFYDPALAPATGACGLPLGTTQLAAALNPTDFAGSVACDACIKVAGPIGDVTVPVLDLCQACAAGGVLLSEPAFAQIGATAAGTMPVTWQFVPCNLTDPVRYFFAPASSQYWLAVQVRNIQHEVTKLEIAVGQGAFVELPRADYNFFVAAAGVGPGPFSFRVTDSFGQQLTDVDIALSPGAEVAGAAQFPACGTPIPVP